MAYFTDAWSFFRPLVFSAILPRMRFQGIHITIFTMLSELPGYETESIPSIIAWTDAFQSPELHTWFLRRLVSEKCSKQCNFFPRSEMKNVLDYDAVIFHSRDIDYYDLPKSRRPDQLYLLFSLEAPGNRGESSFGKFPPHFFNGTISYSRLNNYTFDYDVPASENITVSKEFVRNKTDLVLGVVSNCNSDSEREETIHRLREHINITMRGRCYGKAITDDQLAMLKKSHRFILALENKICPEYVTEKAYRFKELIVPIVYSRRITADVLPLDSFIAIDDFDSTPELKEYLEKLQDDDDEYMKYFAWLYRKEDREVKRKGVCKICSDLHSPMLRHSSLSHAAFPDEGTCTMFPWKWRNYICAFAMIFIVLLSIGVRFLFLHNRRYGNYELVNERL